MKRIYQVAKFGVGALLSGCSLFGPSSQDFERLSGKYVLESIDGVPVNSTASSSSGCPAKTVDGQLILSAPSGATRALYSITTATRPACETFASHPLVDIGVSDVGQWDLSSDQLGFNSEMKLGNYRGFTSGDADMIRIETTIGGHVYLWTAVPSSDQPAATLTVKIVDSAGNPVSNTFFEFTDAVRIVTRGTTRQSGEINQPSPAGGVSIALAPPAGFSMMPGQANPIQTTLTAGQVTSVSVVLK